MKNRITTIMLVLVLAVIAFGYIPTPVTTFPPHDPNAPQVMGTKTLYVGNDAVFQIDVEDSNDDTVTVTAENGAVTKLTSEYMGDMNISDANGTFVLHIYKTTYEIKFHPVIEGYHYPLIIVTDSQGAIDEKYVEINALKKNIAPVITGCRILD